MRYDTILLDLDGTLIDSAPDICRAANLLLAEHDLPAITLVQAKSFIGDGAPRLIERAFSAAGRPLDPARLPTLTERFIDLYETHEPDASCIFPGVMETLAALAAGGAKLGLCTNKAQRSTEMVVRTLGLDRWLGAVVGGDALPVRKPHAGHGRAVIEKLGGDIDRAVMVGDSPADMGVARDLGIPSVAVSYGYPRMPVSSLGANFVIDRFDQLPATLEQLAAEA